MKINPCSAAPTHIILKLSLLLENKEQLNSGLDQSLLLMIHSLVFAVNDVIVIILYVL